ncbi:hypothetical protein [Serinibacter salmoneus]|uniref:Uncharacterized protein n=1 Tax=Serinibacter salmoneus TaxID=556530 RepID=A0A2A9D530_9MICO|nr:hypothetical protein [Serinibacter salmoneus]PFG21062.1 hypothetical protein ATL40_2682 [Serinibacter salmoneus]
MPVPDIVAVPPQAYSGWLWLLALLLLLAVGAWYVVLPRLARREPGHPGTPVDALRQQHHALVDDAYARYEAGEIDLRALHLEYNRLLRDYGTARTGRDLSSLTARDLDRLADAGPLREALDSFSEPAFAAESDAEARRATETTRAVIASW